MPSFWNLLQNVIAEKSGTTTDTAVSKSENTIMEESETLCDCEIYEESCVCEIDEKDSSNEPASCFDCPNRENCAHHAGGGHDALAERTRLKSASIKENVVAQTNEISSISFIYNYNNAYAWRIKNKNE